MSQDQNRSSEQPYEPLNPNHPRLAIKADSAFLLMDTEGMLPAAIAQGFGLYREDTRWLRRWDWQLNGKPFFLLNSNVLDGYAAKFVYSNTADELPAQSLLIERELVITDKLTERLTVRNYAGTDANLSLTLRVDNDFADMFEVRGTQRPKRGRVNQPEWSADSRRLRLSYVGLDGILRETFVDFNKKPAKISSSSATFTLRLKRQESAELIFAVNTAIEMDPYGQVNVEGIGDKIVGGIGGHPDYCTAARLHPHGLSIIAVPSRFNGRSTLVDRLSRPASTPAHDVDVVVTETGHVDLRSAGWTQRRKLLEGLFDRAA